jgi:hypothetical protein
MLTYDLGPPGQYATPDGRLGRRRGRDGVPARVRHLRTAASPVEAGLRHLTTSGMPRWPLPLPLRCPDELVHCLDEPVLLWAALNWPLTAVNVLLNLRFSIYPLYIDWGST